MTLRRPRDVERAANVVEPAMVVQHVHPGRVDEPAGCLVAQARAVVPTIPQALDHLEVLGRHGVAQRVRRVFRAAEIGGGVRA